MRDKNYQEYVKKFVEECEEECETELDSKAIEFITTAFKVFLARRDAKKNKFNRVLAMGDYFFDRWEKARYLGFGEGSSIYDNSLVLGDVKVGKNTWIGPFTVLDGSNGLTIGDNCSISAGVQIYTHDTVKWALSGGQVGPEKAPTIVGSNCYIGPYTVIGKGVVIGNKCMIGANSLVLNDIPSGSKAYGTPCRVVGTVDE